MKGWGPELVKRRPRSDGDSRQVSDRMYRTNPDFVFTVTRDFVRNCRRRCSSCRMTFRRTPTGRYGSRMLAPKAK